MTRCSSRGQPFSIVRHSSRAQTVGDVLVAIETSASKARRWCTGRRHPGEWLAIMVASAGEEDRPQFDELTREIQAATGHLIEVGFVDQGYTGNRPSAATEARVLLLEDVRLLTTKHGSVLLPHCSVVGCSFAWMMALRRLRCCYEAWRRRWSACIS